MATELSSALQRLRQYGWDGLTPALVVLGDSQTLHLLPLASPPLSWPVATGNAGFGCQDGSGRTPVGLHRICAKIGADAPAGMVFQGRLATGRIVPDSDDPAQDWITSRILWLEGLEPGVNQGAGVDSRERYIYLHGTPYAAGLGRPCSAGCVRLANAAVIDLFDRVTEGTLVLIVPPTEG